MKHISIFIDAVLLKQHTYTDDKADTYTYTLSEKENENERKNA